MRRARSDAGTLVCAAVAAGVVLVSVHAAAIDMYVELYSENTSYLQVTLDASEIGTGSYVMADFEAVLTLSTGQVVTRRYGFADTELRAGRYTNWIAHGVSGARAAKGTSFRWTVGALGGKADRPGPPPRTGSGAVSQTDVALGAPLRAAPPAAADSPSEATRHRAPAAGKADRVPDVPRAAAFSNPGYFLDWCLYFQRECGQPAADRYCRDRGFSRAARFAKAEGVGATQMTVSIGDGRVCNQPYCDGFATIECE